MKFTPASDRILVKPSKKKDVSDGGIILTQVGDVLKQTPTRGKVVSLGSGKVLNNGEVLPFSVKVGDDVVFHKHSGIDLEIDKEHYLLMREDNIVAVLEE